MSESAESAEHPQATVDEIPLHGGAGNVQMTDEAETAQEAAWQARQEQIHSQELRVQALRIAAEFSPRGPDAGFILKKAAAFAKWLESGDIPAGAEQA